MADFRPGQLVGVNPDMVASGVRVDLFNLPGGVPRVIGADQTRAIGWLVRGDVALVIAQERTKAGDVYVLGPHGGGWAPAAFLRILLETNR